MRYKVLSAVLILCIIGVLVFLFLRNPGVTNISQGQIKINNAKLNLIYARTDQEKSKGLGYRDTLDKNTGMLFVYDKPQIWTFWMQGMRFPLDFIWIENSKVADITENVPDPSLTNNQPVVVQPKVPVSLILEVNAGWIKEHNIKIGDAVLFN
jgi:uncharacterized protein